MAEVRKQNTWQKLKDLYFAAADLHGDQREGFLSENCPPGDPMREELQRLLLAEQQHAGVLDAPIQMDMESSETVLVLPTGTQLGQYTILEVLGTGGLGVVYRAEDTLLKRVVAVKVLKREAIGQRARLRLLREARIASSFTHPNIVAIYNVGSSDGIDYIVMELVAGQTLRELIEHSTLDIETTLAIAVQIADALSTLHDASIVHRDIKPTNVLLTEAGQVKVLDFGLAKSSLPQAEAGMKPADETADGVMAGTYAYMSPEQAQGKPVDARSDTFAFGALLYELLSGQRAFPGDNGLAVLSAVQQRDPRPLKEVAPDTPREVRALIDRCLSKDPRKRWQNIADVKLLLSDILERIKEDRRTAPRSASEPAASDGTSANAPAVASIAVLPFRDLSPERDQEYFCEGMSEELINALSGVDGVRVAARSSSFRLASLGADLRKIGEQLRVDTVLDGSVRKAGNRLRIVAQLVDVRDGYHVWSDRYDRELDDVFAIQDDIARGLVDKLAVSLATPSNRALVKRQTASIGAYSLYLQGRYYWSRRYAGFLQRAMDSFEQAIALDPSYAPAHAGLSEAFSLLGVYAILPPAIAIARGKPLAERAIALDPTSAEAHEAMALVRWYFDWDFDAAVRVYAQALTLMPSSGVLRGLYGILLADLGRFDEAVAQVTQARELEPVSALVGFYAAATLAISGPLDRALTECERVLELDPGFLPVLWVQATALSRLSRHAEAIAAANRAMELARRQGFFLACAATVHAAAGERQQAGELLRQLHAQREQTYVSPLCLAEISAALGDVDDAFNWLERALEERTPFLVALGVSPAYDRLRSDPRFPPLLQRIGLEGVQPASRHA